MLVKSIMPLEYKVFDHKFIKFSDLNNYYTIDQLNEKIKENQIILDEIYNLKLSSATNLNSIPQKIYLFFDLLKEYKNFNDRFTSKFQELYRNMKF